MATTNYQSTFVRETLHHDGQSSTQIEPFDWISVIHKLGPRFAARADEADRADLFVAQNYADLKEHGVFRAAVPAELGGGDASIAELSTMLRELSHYCSSTALALAMHTHAVALPAWRWRHEGAPVEALLRRVASEQIVLVSSGGSDWLDSSGRLEPTEGGYLMNGRKGFASASPAGTLLVTSGVYDDPTEGPIVLHFGLPMQAEGVQLTDTWRALGMRGTGSHEIILNNVFVPAELDQWSASTRAVGPLFHLVTLIALPLIYSVYVGVAEAAAAIAVNEAAKKRTSHDVQLLVGEMESELAAAQIALSSAIDLASVARPGPETTSSILVRRMLMARAVLRTVDKAMEVAGGSAFLRPTGLERLFRDAQGARYHPLPEKAQQRLTGRLRLGLDINS